MGIGRSSIWMKKVYLNKIYIYMDYLYLPINIPHLKNVIRAICDIDNLYVKERKMKKRNSSNNIQQWPCVYLHVSSVSHVPLLVLLNPSDRLSLYHDIFLRYRYISRSGPLLLTHKFISSDTKTWPPSTVQSARGLALSSELEDGGWFTLELQKGAWKRDSRSDVARNAKFVYIKIL